MWSGRKTLGKSTALGSGKMGISGGSMWCSGPGSVHRPRLLRHVVHQHVPSQRARRGEVLLAVADLGDAADEADEVVVAREHERVDEAARLAALGHLGERLRHYERVEAERVAVDVAVGLREGRRLAVGDHDDL